MDTRMTLTFRVNGVPGPQGSKRHVGRGRMVEMSKKVGPWRDAVILAAQMAKGSTFQTMRGPVEVRVEFYLPRPKHPKHPVHPIVPPDLDKLQRSTGDALKTAAVIADDSLIVHWDPWKRYADDIRPVGAVITVTELQ